MPEDAAYLAGDSAEAAQPANRSAQRVDIRDVHTPTAQMDAVVKECVSACGPVAVAHAAQSSIFRINSRCGRCASC
jgi:hypothetical protein